MLTRDEWDEAAAYWENWLTKFEDHILPVFHNHGINKNVALQVYALACEPTELEIDESEEWKEK